MRTITDRGVVLRSRTFSEYDAILTLLTEHSGKVSVLAKGVRRPSSRMSGILQPFSVIRFERSVPRAENSFSRLIRAECLRQPPASGQPELFFFAEVAEKFSREEQTMPYYFELLREAGQARHLQRAACVFLLKTLTLYGYLPETELCARGGEKLFGDSRWLDSGEIVCVRHGGAEGVELAFDEIKTVRFWQRASLEHAEQVALADTPLRKIFRHLLEFTGRQGVTLATGSLVYSEG